MAFRFAEDYRARLDRLGQRLGGLSGRVEGGRSLVRPGRVELRESRPHAAGDDARDIDWRAYLRLGELATKQFENTESPEVLLIADRSASMGEEGGPKDRLLREVFGALLRLALEARCETSLMTLAEGGPVTLGTWRVARRLEDALRLVSELGPPLGSTHLGGLRFLRPPRGPGRLVVFASDFLASPLPREALEASLRPGDRWALLRTETAEERSPSLPRSGRLRDPESEKTLEFGDGSALLAAYAEVRREHEEELEGVARGLGSSVTSSDEASDFESVVAELLGLSKGGV